VSPTNVNTIATGRVKRKFGKRRVGLEAFLGWRTAGKVRECLIPRYRAVSGATRHALERVPPDWPRWWSLILPFFGRILSIIPRLHGLKTFVPAEFWVTPTPDLIRFMLRHDARIEVSDDTPNPDSW